MTFVASLRDDEIRILQEYVESAGFELKEVAHAHFGAKGEGVSLTVYRSGKCVIQGKGTDQFVAARLPDHMKAPEEPVDRLLDLPELAVGSDESGKGDYFGPLVTAAVAFGPEHASLLEETAIGDSKKLSPAVIRKSAEIIKASLPHEIVVVSPQRYNELYQKFGNLNTMLAWCHGTALERVLEKTDAKTIIVDKFCDERVLRRQLKDRARSARLILESRAEAWPAVGAASILASDTFSRRLEFLSRDAGLTLPKGAGSNVDATARRLVQGQGFEALGRFAKMHFANTRKI